LFGEKSPIGRQRVDFYDNSSQKRYASTFWAKKLPIIRRKVYLLPGKRRLSSVYKPSLSSKSLPHYQKRRLLHKARSIDKLIEAYVDQEKPS
jgi:hypothetical protein